MPTPEEQKYYLEHGRFGEPLDRYKYKPDEPVNEQRSGLTSILYKSALVRIGLLIIALGLLVFVVPIVVAAFPALHTSDTLLFLFYTFPLLVFLGVLISGIGVIASVVIWIRNSRNRSSSV